MARKKQKTSTSGLTFGLKRIEIPELCDGKDNLWKVCGLVINGKCPAQVALDSLAEHDRSDHRKLMRSIRSHLKVDRVTDEKKVRKSHVRGHTHACEFRAHKGKARLFFFHDEDDDRLIICTDGFSKGQGNQSRAFDRCEALAIAYFDAKKTK